MRDLDYALRSALGPGAGETLGAVFLVVVLLWIAVLLLWFFLPFAVFGTKPILRELREEVREQNRLLGEQNRLLRTLAGRQTSKPAHEVVVVSGDEISRAP